MGCILVAMICYATSSDIQSSLARIKSGGGSTARYASIRSTGK
jgi:hypothetical protein